MPPGTRVLVGLLLMVGGVFGFLPVIGFWMLPLGVAVAAMDIRPLWRKFFGPGHMPPPRSLQVPPSDKEVREEDVDRPRD
nr:hypothetical protein [Maritimibacter sp. DP1N21-5]